MDIYTKTLKDAGKADVLVVGSGSAGATTALAAARMGASMILVERYGFMVGISTQVLDTFYGFYTPGSVPKKVVGGIPDLVVDELMKRGMVLLRPNTYGAGQGITYDPETLKVIWENLAVQAGMKLLYHTFVIDVLKDSDRVCGVDAAGKGGLVRLEGRGDRRLRRRGCSCRSGSALRGRQGRAGSVIDHHLPGDQCGR